MNEEINEPWEVKEGLNNIFDKVLHTVKAICYSATLVALIGLLASWFMYEVDGKPLSSHTSELGGKLIKELVDDGYLAGAKVLFTKEEYCHQRSGRPGDCLTNDDQKKLDNLIDSLIHWDVPPIKK